MSQRGQPVARGFPPVAGAGARVLVLGSMPGRASLGAREYYAHPRNAFWPIIGELLAFPPNASYPQRLALIRRSHLAVWDVLQSCERPSSSLDADIVAASVVTNDFARFFRTHPQVSRVLFNGATAEQMYRRHVLPALPGPQRELSLLRLPSTSPANARLDFAAKRRAWQRALAE